MLADCTQLQHLDLEGGGLGQIMEGGAMLLGRVASSLSSYQFAVCCPALTMHRLRRTRLRGLWWAHWCASRCEVAPLYRSTHSLRDVWYSVAVVPEINLRSQKIGDAGIQVRVCYLLTLSVHSRAVHCPVVI